MVEEITFYMGHFIQMQAQLSDKFPEVGFLTNKYVIWIKIAVLPPTKVVPIYTPNIPNYSNKRLIVPVSPQSCHHKVLSTTLFFVCCQSHKCKKFL